MYDYSGYGSVGSYDYGYGAAETVGTGLAVAGGFLLVMWLIGMAISVFTIVCNWKVFKKAGKPGWASIIPIYNTIVMIEIAELPMWYIALFFVPFANIYAMFKIYIELAHKFGKSTGFGVAMVFFAPICFAILAFDKKVVYNGEVQTTQPMQQPVSQQPVYTQPEVQPVQPVVTPVMPMPEVPVTPVAPIVEPTVPVTPVTPVMEQPTPVVEPTEPVMAQPQVQSPAFCTNCGSPLMPGAKFCTNCGKQM